MPSSQLPLFSKLGHGYNVVTGQSRNRLVRPAFENRGTYTFRGTPYEVPNGVTVEPSPESIVISTTGLTIQKQIHDFQTTMGMSMGVKVDTFGEFSRTQKAQDRLSVFNSSTKYFADASGSFGFFKMRLDERVDGEALEERFVEDALACDDDDAFRDFVEAYGTHVVTEGTVGGEMLVTVDVDMERMKQELATDSALGGQVSAEIQGIPVNGSIDFDVRSSKTNENFRACSNRTIVKSGGDVTARTPDEWQASLRDASLPEMNLQAEVPVDGPGQPLMEAPGTSTLAFKVSQLRPVSSLLRRSHKEAADALGERIRAYMVANKIDSRRRTLDPLVGGGGALHLVAPGGSYHCGAWALATTGIKFGLKAFPGVRAQVRIWHTIAREQTVPLWAGETHDASGFYGAGNLWVYLDCDEPSARLKLHVW